MIQKLSMRITLLTFLLAAGIFLPSHAAGDAHATQRIPHLLITLSETLSTEESEKLAMESRTLFCLLQHCDKETRQKVLSTFVQLLTETYQQAERSHSRHSPSRALNDGMTSLCDTAREHLQQSPDLVHKRFWHETPGYPAYNRPAQSYGEPLQLLIPVVLVVVLFLARDYISNKKATENQEKYQNAGIKLTHAQNLTTAIEKIVAAAIRKAQEI